MTLRERAVKLIPEEVWERNRCISEDLWKDGRPKKWYYAIPIIVFWLFLVGLAVKAVLF